MYDIGTFIRHDHHRYDQLWDTTRLCHSEFCLWTVLVCPPSLPLSRFGTHIPRRAYVSLAVLICFPMLMIWFNKPHDLNTFTPAWAFLVRSRCNDAPIAFMY